MSIATKLAELTQIRTDIRTALTGKGVSASDHDFADFSTDIASIPSGGGEPEILAQQGFIKVDTGWLACKETYAYYLGNCAKEDKSNYTVNPSTTTSIREIIRFKLNSIPSNDNNRLAYSLNQGFYDLRIKSGGKPNCRYYNGYGTTETNVNYTLETGVFYYLCVRWYNHTTTLALYDDNGNLLSSATSSQWDLYNTSDTPTIGGRNASNTAFTVGVIDIAHSCIEINGTVVWGIITNKMQNMGVIT